LVVKCWLLALDPVKHHAGSAIVPHRRGTGLDQFVRPEQHSVLRLSGVLVLGGDSVDSNRTH
jgi:hypothetical protein